MFVLESWPVEELWKWLAYSRVECLPDAHWDAAMIAHSQARTWGSGAKLEDFLPRPAAGKTMSHKQLKSKLIIRLGAKKRGEEA
jgi:hypothetical protein